MYQISHALNQISSALYGKLSLKWPQGKHQTTDLLIRPFLQNLTCQNPHLDQNQPFL